MCEHPRTPHPARAADASSRATGFPGVCALPGPPALPTPQAASAVTPGLDGCLSLPLPRERPVGSPHPPGPRGKDLTAPPGLPILPVDSGRPQLRDRRGRQRRSKQIGPSERNCRPDPKGDALRRVVRQCEKALPPRSGPLCCYLPRLFTQGPPQSRPPAQGRGVPPTSESPPTFTKTQGPTHISSGVFL